MVLMPRLANSALIAVATTGLIALVAVVLIGQTGALKWQDQWVASELTVPVVSARGHPNDGSLRGGYIQYDYELIDSAAAITFWDSRPRDIAVVIHGFSNSVETATVKFRPAERTASGRRDHG